MKYTGKIISLAFPDTFVRFPNEYVFEFFPLFGLGKNRIIKAGHAALVLVENDSGRLEYYDFGRYITPSGKGRVRSAITDVELNIPFKATFSEHKEVTNLKEILIWLEQHPEKTHGSGRMVASICDYVSYEKAKAFILDLQNQGSIPYLTFGKEGTNCSRIVTDTLIAATDRKDIRKPLLRNKKFTPSPLGNVEKSSCENQIYQVVNGEVSTYTNSVFKENMTNYFDKKIPDLEQSYTTDALSEHIKKTGFLSGIGSSAYFSIEKITGVPKKNMFFEITRYTAEGILDFKGIFKANIPFDINEAYHFVYDSNCSYCHISQQDKIIRFDIVEHIPL